MGFVIARPEIGYVQSMSYVCSLLCMFVNRIQGFICFTNLITAPSLMPFYMLNEHNMHQKFQIFKNLFNINCSELCVHFE